MIHKKSDTNGQIFVLGAMLIAIILVSLAFSLNMVIYSENTAARGSSVAESNALNHYNSLDSLIDRDIQAHNEQLYMDRSNLETSTDSSLDILIEAEKKRQTRKASLSETEATPTYGILLAQDDFSREFRAEDGSTDWFLTSLPKSIHKFKQRINSSSLTEVSQTEIDNNGLGGVGALTVDFGGKSVYIYEYQNNGNIRVHVQGESPCSLTGSPSDVRINYVEATVNGSDCPELGFIDGNDWAISITNGYAGQGVYGLMIGDNTSEFGVETGNFNDPNTTTANPYYHHIITTVEYTTYYDGPKQTASHTSTRSAQLPSDTQ